MSLEVIGTHQGMSSRDYHRVPALSASALKELRRSPAHYWGRYRDPARPAQEPTAAMRNGTLVHACIFEPDEVAARYAVKPAGLDGRTKEGKAWAAEHADRETVDAEVMARAQAQAAALRRLPDVAELLREGFAEASAFWIDDITLERCKCRPDWVRPAGDGVILLDGKTCQDASADGFARSVWTYAYHLQAAHYIAGWEAATGQRVHGFVFAAVESDWPHAAAAYMLADDVLDRARAERRRLLDLYADCQRSGQWPGYPAGIQPLNLPAWAKDPPV